MNDRLSLRKGISWTFIGQIANTIAQFTIIYCIAKFEEVETLGLYGIVNGLISPIQLFLMFGLGKLLITNNNFKNNIGAFNTIILFSSIIIPLISILISLIIYNDSNILNLVFSLSLYKSTINLRQYLYSFYQKFERTDIMGKSLIIYSIFNAVIFLISFYYVKNLSFSFLLLFILNILILLFNDIINIKNKLNIDLFSFSFNRFKIKKILNDALPLGTTSIFVSLKSNLPKYMLEFILNDRLLLGYFTAFSQISNVLGFTNQAVSKTVIGRLNILFKKNIKSYFSFLKIVSFLSFLFGLFSLLIVIFLGEYMITLIFNESYAEYKYILFFLFSARLFVMPTTYLKLHQIITGQIKSQLKISVFAIFLFLILALSLVDFYKDLAIFIALVTVDFAVLLLTYAFIDKLKNDKK